MSEIQTKKLNKIIHSWQVEGFYTPEEEKKILISVLEGRISYKEILKRYIKEAQSYAGV